MRLSMGPCWCTRVQSVATKVSLCGSPGMLPGPRPSASGQHTAPFDAQRCIRTPDGSLQFEQITGRIPALLPLTLSPPEPRGERGVGAVNAILLSHCASRRTRLCFAVERRLPWSASRPIFFLEHMACRRIAYSAPTARQLQHYNAAQCRPDDCFKDLAAADFHVPFRQRPEPCNGTRF